MVIQYGSWSMEFEVHGSLRGLSRRLITSRFTWCLSTGPFFPLCLPLFHLLILFLLHLLRPSLNFLHSSLGMFLVPEQESLQSSHGNFGSTIENVGSEFVSVCIEVFLVNEAFVASFFSILVILRLLVFLERVEMFEKLSSLSWNGIVQGNVDVESTWALESIIKSVGMIGRCKQNRVFLSPVNYMF